MPYLALSGRMKWIVSSDITEVYSLTPIIVFVSHIHESAEVDKIMVLLL